tara:strand:+ start:269 stop:532 length:264 start_codon:yes stop_codon:yes gene_type:complete
MKYARQCDITGEGMNEGWCWSDGMFYSKYEKDTLLELRKDFKDETKGLTDDEVFDWAVEEEEILYWTEWYDEDDLEFEEVNGKLISL